MLLRLPQCDERQLKRQPISSLWQQHGKRSREQATRACIFCIRESYRTYLLSAILCPSHGCFEPFRTPRALSDYSKSFSNWYDKLISNHLAIVNLITLVTNQQYWYLAACTRHRHCTTDNPSLIRLNCGADRCKSPGLIFMQVYEKKKKRTK